MADINRQHKIYGLREIGSELIKYIGVTKLDLKRRLMFHLRDCKKSIRTMWFKSIDNQVEIVLLEDNLSEKEAYKKETEYILLFKSVGAKLKNMTMGGDNPPKHYGPLPEKTKLKISISNKIAQLGKRVGKDNHKSVTIKQINRSTGEVIATFESKRQASISTGVCKNSIHRNLKNPNKCKGGGYIWQI